MTLNQNQITEQDLDYIFSDKKPRHRKLVWDFVKYFSILIIIFIIIFVAINYQATFHKIDYWYQVDFKNNDKTTKDSFKIIQSNQSANLPAVSLNHIYIPKIMIDAPVIFGVKNNSNDTSRSLQNGAIQLWGTALPGTIGNVFITAHSSNYAWAPGDYKNLFSLLDNLVVGDEIYLNYQSITYVYKVYDIKVTNPSDLSVLNQGTDSKLTLMTCTPVGTSLNRLIVLANQIYPDTSNNLPSNFLNTNNSLPTVR